MPPKFALSKIRIIFPISSCNTSFDKEHLPEEKKGSVQRNGTQQLNSSDSIYPKSMQKCVAGLPVHCATLSSLTVVPAHLQQPATSLALLWQGRAGVVSFVYPYFSFSVQKSAGHLLPKIEEDRSCANRWFQEHFPQEQGFSSTIALKL